MSDQPDQIEDARDAALRRLREEAATGAVHDGDLPPPPDQDAYAGLATRVIAFALDAAVINAVGIAVGVTVGLGLSILHLPSQVDKAMAAIGGVVFIVWTVGYFVFFWSTTGQSPGARVMRLRVVTAKGEKLKPRRALVRFVGVVLGALPLFAGYVLILFDHQRRGFQDRFARTLVVEEPQLSVPARRRPLRREAAAPEGAVDGSSDSGDDDGRPLPDAGLEPDRLAPDSANRNGASGQTQDDIGKETATWQR